MKMEPIVSSETSAIRTQTLGNYPKRNNLHYLDYFFFFRYLASGNTFVDLHYSYRLGEKTTGNCVRTVCKALWDQLVEEQLPFPTEKS